jgi:3-hydroxy-9,10-secoandrosta-1,3,5(10)-triene-9,17-dione monooxygenase
MWHPEAQDEIWGASPDSLISSALIFARGRARRVEGGYRLSGRWPFSSGIDASAWNMFGAVVSDEETGQSEHRMLLVPASDYTIIDTWEVIGLAGTGSKDVEVADVFVPAYRTLATERIKGGPNRGSELNPGTLYKLPAVSLFAYALAGVSLGIARGAIQHFAETTRNRLSAYTGKNLADFTNIQVHLAEAAALADAAEAIALRDCDEAMRITEAGGRHPVRRDRRRRDLSEEPDPASVPRRPRGQCPLPSELGRQRRNLRQGGARAATRRAALRVGVWKMISPAVTPHRCEAPRARTLIRAISAMRSAPSRPG